MNWVLIGLVVLAVGGTYFYPTYGQDYPAPAQAVFAFTSGATTQIANSVEESVAEKSNTQERTDLRTLVPSNINTSEAEVYCTSHGGTWSWMHDWVGCIGAGTDQCSNALIQVGVNLCSGASANWTCDEQNVYCKYV